MNPLLSVKGTIITGFVLAIIAAVVFRNGAFSILEIEVWLHSIAGVLWIGLLYYFNFVQVPGVGAALADSDGPGPAAINKYIAPRALFWFRWAAVATWITGVGALANLLGHTGALNALIFNGDTQVQIIGLGAWLGTIMLFNVWVLIWPNQKKILGLDGKEHSADAIASAKKTALLASRTNAVLSIPMLLCMTAYGHGGMPF
ncbi:MAG: urate hydroxylase PuuD [Gammaproteobacteria bacterium]|nr:urate hydroxylase PuuD [Gammaproteobacteria bacterium]